jgi:hypothetical protein
MSSNQNKKSQGSFVAGSKGRAKKWIDKYNDDVSLGLG